MLRPESSSAGLWASARARITSVPLSVPELLRGLILQRDRDQQHHHPNPPSPTHTIPNTPNTPRVAFWNTASPDNTILLGAINPSFATAPADLNATNANPVAGTGTTSSRHHAVAAEQVDSPRRGDLEPTHGPRGQRLRRHLRRRHQRRLRGGTPDVIMIERRPLPSCVALVSCGRMAGAKSSCLGPPNATEMTDYPSTGATDASRWRRTARIVICTSVS